MRLIGNNDIGDALKKLDRLTGEAAQMAAEQSWKASQSIIEDNAMVVADHGVAGIDINDMVRVDGHVTGVDDRVIDVDNRVQTIDDRVVQVINGARYIFNQSLRIV